MTGYPYEERLRRCTGLMKTAGLDLLVLAKPANMFYLAGDGRLCAYARVTQDGKVALGVPQTSVLFYADRRCSTDGCFGGPHISRVPV